MGETYNTFGLFMVLGENAVVARQIIHRHLKHRHISLYRFLIIPCNRFTSHQIRQFQCIFQHNRSHAWYHSIANRIVKCCDLLQFSCISHEFDGMHRCLAQLNRYAKTVIFKFTHITAKHNQRRSECHQHQLTAILFEFNNRFVVL